MQCYLVEFLFSLIRNSSTDSVTALETTSDTRQMAESSLVDSVIYYMQENRNMPPALDALCRHFSVSRTYLCRIFREATQTSPVHFWIDLKIKEAKRLIREGNHNVTQISEMLGYSNIHHFTRMFKRFAGMSPTAYRSSLRY
jgi:AraC-like DNA-binding protein